MCLKKKQIAPASSQTTKTVSSAPPLKPKAVAKPGGEGGKMEPVAVDGGKKVQVAASNTKAAGVIDGGKKPPAAKEQPKKTNIIDDTPAPDDEKEMPLSKMSKDDAKPTAVVGAKDPEAKTEADISKSDWENVH